MNEGSILGGVAVPVDVTQRKEAEVVLRESQQRLKLFVENVPVAVAMFDKDMRYLAASRRWLEDHNLSEPIVGRPHYEDPFDIPDHWKVAHRRALAGEISSDDDECVKCIDGEVKQLRWECRPWHTADGEVGGIIIFTEDVTERKRAEYALREREEHLRNSDKRKDEFLAMLSHELRNPLAPIRAGLQTLRRMDGQNPAVQPIHDMMERQVDHLVRLVDDLLDVSRITLGRIVLKKEQVALATVIGHAVDMSRDLIEVNGLEIRLDLPDDPLLLDADPVRLTQVFANLLNNAAKFTDRGGRIEIAAECVADEAIASVADTGVGIPQDILPRIFDLFAQGDRTCAQMQGGLGIGLVLVRKLVELHDGRIAALSEGEGRGSRFVVHLPLSALATPKPPPECAAYSKLTTRRVLVVDDTPDVADSLALLIETLGAEVRVAYSGAQGLAICAEFEPELAFLDLGMPEMDGFETARRLRELPAGRDATLVALTGWGEEETRRRVNNAGFDRHLTKPADAEEIEALLKAAPGKPLA